MNMKHPTKSFGSNADLDITLTVNTKFIGQNRTAETSD